MTEQEAHTKWCPFSRKHHANGSYNRTDTTPIPGGTHCIGSKCAAWRWVLDPLTEFVSEKKSLPSYKGEHGYCGLAGQV